MASMPDLATNLATDVCGGDLLPLSPFNALHYHFGMLLGVDDFETEQAYHRAKMRLHNAWLHREGVVWGFGVTVDDVRGEIRVQPGLALDAAGHELHLDAEYCINVGAWFDKRRKEDPDFPLNPDNFDAHVLIRFKACLSRQVPALMEPCANGGSGTAYSRVNEVLDILLLPNRAPQRVNPYHRLRVLFGLEEATTVDAARLAELEAAEAAEEITAEELALLKAVRRDRLVLDEVNRIEGLPVAQQPSERLKAFHRFAALDEIDLQPAKTVDGAETLLFPGQEDDPVVLADVTELTLTRKDGAWVLSGGSVDTSVRPSHVATTTIQDLLCGRFGAASGAGAPDTGPRVDPDPEQIILTSKTIQFRVDKDLLDASVKPEAFSVSWFTAESGWQISTVPIASYGGGETKTVKLELDSDISGRVRLIVFGTGPTPLLGADLAPLAGAIGGPPGTMHEGHDFVFMKDFAAPEPEVEEPPAPPAPEEPGPPAPLPEEEIRAEDALPVADEAKPRSSPKAKTRRSKTVK